MSDWKKTKVKVYTGDCLKVLPTLAEASVDAVVTDPPYGLEFMGKEWDRLWAEGGWEQEGYQGNGGLKRWKNKRPIYQAGKAAETWHLTWATAVLRVLKPGGYMLAFGGTRTFHRLTCAIEDAGFEIRDCIGWLYGSGFPKGKGCLKPAWEPIILARKPGKKVLPLQIEACRVPTDSRPLRENPECERINGSFETGYKKGCRAAGDTALGRWPANLIHDGSEEVLEAFPETASGKPGKNGHVRNSRETEGVYGYSRSLWQEAGPAGQLFGDSGSAARFFYCAKSSRSERGKSNKHPTVKPLSLMRYLCRLITPKGGIVLDPFLGSGTTVIAAMKEKFNAIGIEKDANYVEIARKRIERANLKLGIFASAVKIK